MTIRIVSHYKILPTSTFLCRSKSSHRFSWISLHGHCFAMEFGDSHLEMGFPSETLESEPSEEHRSIPCQCLSDMIPDFKRVLKNIAEDITEIPMLMFMCDINLMDTRRETPTALEILWKQWRKGIFAHDNIEPLERLLKDIDRCDLASKYIEPYKQKYGEHTTSKGRGISSPARSIRRTPSARSLPATSLHSAASQSSSATFESMTGEARSERKANTDPSSQRSRIKQISQAKAQKYAAGMHSVPEEESSATSLRLPTSSLRPNMVPSFQPQIHARADQNWSDTQSEVYSLGNATSGAHTPTRPGGDHHDIRCRSRHRSATPRDRESTSTPASGRWSANLQDPDIVEEPSFSLSELEENGEYNSSSLRRDLHSRCSTAASGQSYPYLHSNSYPHDSEAALSACSTPFPMHHHSGSAQCPAHSSCCSLPAVHVMQPPLYPSPHSAFQYPGQQHGHMTSPGPYQYRKQGACRSGSSSTQPPKTHTTNYTWAVPRKCLLKGMQQHGKPLKSRVNFSLPVGCKRRRDPKVSLSVIPCESGESRHVVIDGELLIPRNCSRHKWLVEYCDCSVCLSVEVINPKNNKIIGNTSGEFAIAHSEVSCDHRTPMKLDRVLEHQAFLYGNADVDKFHFHAKVQLFELECRLDNTVQYECKESDFEFTEISILSVPSQVASSQ